ncbi:MAG: BTAD domain-containing putative transcriptional regulator [Stackebrandtia sp.]
MRVEFGILGPLEVLRDGESVRLPGRVQPRLLAVLLTEAGRVVPLGRIVEAIWDADPPNTARRQVQNNAALLRKLLGGFVEPVGEGYRILLDDDQLDSRRFEATVRAARERSEAGDREAALDALREGLSLWRGPALAGLSGRLIESGAQRLDEAKLAAIEERVDLELRLGREEQVAAEVRGLTLQHPFRERLAGQLMLALYRAGHGGEALEAYEAVRSRLAEELGVDPGQRLRDLHSAILREDSALDATALRPDQWAPGAGGGPAMPTPAQLPADTAAFAGRDDQLAKLDELLDAGEGAAVLSTVTGIGGVGKTALAVHWAHQRRGRFPDGQLHVNLRGFDRGEPVSPQEALNGFLRALGQSGDSIPSDIDEAAALYRSLLADKHMLVLLDNARDVAQVRPLMPASPGTFALVTSRDRLAGLTALDDARPLRLDTLDQSDCLELLANLLGVQRVRAEAEAAQRLAEVCGRLPLAIRIAAANLAAQPHVEFADFIAELEGADRLKLLTVDGDPDAAVAATFDHSHRALHAEAQDLFMRLGLIPGHDFTPALAAAVVDRPDSENKLLLDRLENAHLLEQHQPGRYRFHDLLKEYAKQRADVVLNDADRAAVRDRVVEWYYQRRDALPDPEFSNVVAAFDAWKHHDRALPLAMVLGLFVNDGHNPAEIRRHVESVLPSAERHGDPVGLYHVHHALAAATIFDSADDSVEFGRKMLAAAEGLADGETLMDASYRLGISLYSFGRNAEAEPLLRTALHGAESVDEPHVLTNRLTALAATCRVLGRFAETEELLLRAEQVACRQSLPRRSMAIHNSLGLLYMETGRLDEACGQLDEAEKLLKHAASPVNRAILLQRRGQLCWRRGQYAKAKLYLSQAVEQADGVKIRGPMTQYREVFAGFLSDSGQHREALALVESATARRGRQASMAATARRELLLCKIHVGLDEHRQALRHGVEARDVCAAMPYPLRHGQSLAALADAHAGLGDVAAAGECRQRAFEIFDRLGVPEARQLKALLETA